MQNKGHFAVQGHSKCFGALRQIRTLQMLVVRLVLSLATARASWCLLRRLQSVMNAGARLIAPTTSLMSL